MTETIGSSARHAAAAACLLIFTLIASNASAQQPGPQPLAGPSRSPDFLSRYDFQLAGMQLVVDDPRFSWDTHFGGAVDVVDYGFGRLSIVADYEAVLGDELRAFDPNQGNYTLETSGSAFIGSTEVAVVFHHVSRHLSDRPKNFAIAWNVLGGRVLRRVDIDAATTLLVRAGLGHVTQRADVDYQWDGDFDVTIRRAVSPRYDAYARGTGEMFTVDPLAKQHRDTQYGSRIEGGIHINGKAAGLELFAGFEHRIDANQLVYVPVNWFLWGFRLVNR